MEMAQLERLRDGLHAQASGSEQQYEYTRCNGEEHAPRNRYANVNPYLANRVKLEVPEGQSDYINASPVILTTTKSQNVLKYIATQVRYSILRAFRSANTITSRVQLQTAGRISGE
jgi:protein-tyrosine phosphatase